jgi:hypothetical protein
VASVPAGPYTAIAVPVQGYASIFPYIPVTRFPSGGADPGWYDVADISLSVGPAVPLSKTYNGNLADTGYPAPVAVIWDPWSDPAIVPCCYVVRIDIWDRTVTNNVWAGGHGNSGWEAIEIGF